MKNENSFNAFLSKELRKLGKWTHVVKASDKFTVGISDFLIWRNGKSLALEVKFIKDYPKDGSLLLEHAFSGGQLTFLESIDLAGSYSFGLVAVEATKEMCLIPWNEIPNHGNWRTGYFKSINTQAYKWEEVSDMISDILGV